MTNQSGISLPPRASLSFGPLWVRIRNVLHQGARDLARPADHAPARSAEAIEITDHGIFLAADGTALPVPVTPSLLAGRVPPRPIDLVFRDNSCIDLAFSMPTAPLPDLRRMIEAEVQFQSPFAEAAALAFWTAQEQQDGRWQVRAAVVLKARLADLLADLQATGTPVAQVWRDGDGASFAARPDWATGPRPEMTPRALLAALPGTLRYTLAGSALLLASALATTLSLGFVGSRVAAEAGAARANLAQAAQATASLSSLDLSLARSADRLAMAGRLSAALPDGYWLDQLAIEEDSVTLTGFGPSAAEVTRLLTTLPDLTDIAFASPVTRDNSQSLERYRISATLAGAAP